MDCHNFHHLSAREMLAIPIEALTLLPLPPPRHWIDFDRVEGMLLGLAIGDALGNTTESLAPYRRRELYGQIRDYLPNSRAFNQRVGLPSDDSQLAFWLLEHLLDYDHLVPERLADIFCNRNIFGIGKTVAAFCREYRSGRPWYESAQASGRNGALMRIAPVLVPLVRQEPSVDLWKDTMLAGALTHNSSISISACVGFIGILWDLLGIMKAPCPEWWLDTYCRRARPLEGFSEICKSGFDFEFHGGICEILDGPVRLAVANQLPTAAACELWLSGSLLVQTVPSALYILARYSDDPEEAIVRAVNDVYDNDTIAAIVGAAVGALHGRRALPQRWVDRLLGRTTEDDDQRIFQLIAKARAKWW